MEILLGKQVLDVQFLRNNYEENYWKAIAICTVTYNLQTVFKIKVIIPIKR